ncbi:uncharacterized protein LOC122506614 [Leptopilina heterotoma]|uniref:uncharacterized protein LOC122506614 n=1 Tax=Leptopilina heterotoma TaxID=63436 RepID=UPI001CA92920|nr:uncharacterized protein LOC122506614 [Leptopilina heterotoma]
MKISAILLICLFLPNISFSKYSQSFLSFSNLCPDSEVDSPENNEIVDNCLALNEQKTKIISQKLKLVHDIFNLKYKNLILIIAYNTDDAKELGEFLSNNEKLLPRKLRNEFSDDDDQFIYDLIIDNVHLYKYGNESTILFAYPRDTLHDSSYTSQLLLEIVHNISNVKLIFTVADKNFHVDSEKRELEIFQIFEVTARILRNVENFRLSSGLVVSGGKLVVKSSAEGESAMDKRNDYLDIIERYTSMMNATSDRGKLLAKDLIKQENVFIVTGFSLGDHKQLVADLEIIRYTNLNGHDFQSDYSVMTDCLYNSVNVKLIHSMNSLSLALDSALSRRKNLIRSLTGVLNLQETIMNLNDVLEIFLNCTKTPDKIAITFCFQNLKENLQFLHDPNVNNYTKRISNYSTMICFIHSWFDVFATVEYINESEKWTHNLKIYKRMLNIMNNWYLEAKNIYQEVEDLPEEITRKKIAILSKELYNWRVTWNEENRMMMKVAYDTIRSNAIKMSAKIQCGEENLQVKGKLVKLSKVLNGKCYNETRNGIRFLEIFAADKVIIDADIFAVGQELTVAIFSPIWEIVHSREFVLDGFSRNLTIGDYLKSKASNGDKLNKNGADGIAGLHGGAAGRFFGLAETIINPELLKISLNGGRGSNGQSGGDGVDGEEGEIPSEEYITENLRKHSCNWYPYAPVSFRTEASKTVKHYDSLIGEQLGWTYKTECFIYGFRGFPGGNGGNGGLNGKGGSAGEYKLVSLNGSSIHFPVKVWTLNGIDGIPGVGGSGGKGGSTRKVTMKNVNENNFKFPLNETIAIAKDGIPGAANLSTLGSDVRKGDLKTRYFGDLANLYKLFVFSQIDSHESHYIEIYKQMIINKEILKTYDTVTLVKELGDLEEAYHLMVNKSHGLFFYQFWKEGILDHFLQKQEYPTVLRFLDHLVAEKIERIENINEREIYTLYDYLPHIRKQLRNLKIAGKLVQTKIFKTGPSLEKLIEETQYIIQGKIQTQIDQTNQKLTGEIETLLLHILSKRKSSKSLIDNLRLKFLGKVFGEVIQILNTGLGMINPSLGVLALKFSETGSGISDPVDDSSDRSIELQIPKVLNEYLGWFERRLQIRKRVQVSILDYSLHHLGKITREVNSTTTDGKNLVNLENFVSHLRGEASTDLLMKWDVVNVLNNQLDFEKSANTSSKKNLISDLKVHIWVKQMVGELLPSLELDKSNFSLVFALEIGKVFEDTLKIRKFHEEVHERLAPLIQKMRESPETFSAVTYLDFKHFDLRHSLREILTKLETLILEFKILPLFRNVLEELQNAVDKVLETFDRLHDHVEELKRIPYLHDLHLPPFDIAYVKDAKLGLELAKVLQLSYSNNIIDDYQKWMYNFKQYVFPFDKEFHHLFKKQETKKHNIPTLAEIAAENLENYGQQLSENRRKLIDSGKIKFARFGNDIQAFHNWSGGEIDGLLTGKRVKLFANISHHTEWNAVKFSDLWLRINSIDPEIKLEEIAHDLQSFSVKLLHNGDSYYRCGERIFRIMSKSYNLEKMYNDGMRKMRGIDGILVEKFVLSPYATWMVEIVSRDDRRSNDALKKYESKINIELVGLGQYSPGDINECGDLSEYQNFEVVG